MYGDGTPHPTLRVSYRLSIGRGGARKRRREERRGEEDGWLAGGCVSLVPTRVTRPLDN